MRTLLRTTLVAAVAAASIGVIATPAAAAPPPVRADSQSRPVLLIHGYATGSGHDCNSYWGQASRGCPRGAEQGTIYTVGYYEANRNCNAVIRRGNHEVPIESLGFDLAWWIYNNHSQYGRAVDVIGHHGRSGGAGRADRGPARIGPAGRRTSTSRTSPPWVRRTAGRPGGPARAGPGSART